MSQARKRWILILLMILGIGLLSSCSESSPTVPATLDSRLPTPTKGRATPLIGPDGQITVVGPPVTGGNLAGQMFWVKENNIWQGGAAVAGASPMTNRDLGGKPLTKVESLALAKSPSLSPDGTRVAYAYSPEPEGTAGNIVIGQDIYTIDLKTGANTILIKRDEPQTFLDNPRWSNDSKYVYYDDRTPRRDSTNTIVGETLTIRRIELATGKRELLVNGGREASPLNDNQQIVFTGVDENYETKLQILDLQTKEIKNLIDPSKNFLGIYLPRPSPDGQYIAFGGAGGPDSIYQSPFALPSPTIQLTGWLPLMLGLKKHGLPFEVWVIKPDGTGLRRVTDLYEDQPMISWSPDSKRLTFLAGQGLYMVDIDGNNLVRKSEKGGHGGFDWRPN